MSLGMPIQMLNGPMGCPDCGGTCGQRPVMGFGSTAPTQILFNSTPTSDWTCNDWMLWHQLLVQAFMAGKFKSGIRYSKADATKNANSVFMQWWNQVVSWFSYNYSFCGYGSDFLNYFKSVGLTDHISALAATITPIVSSAPKISESVTKVVTNTVDTAANTTSVAKYLVPGIVVLAVGGIGYFVYKNYLKGNKKIKIGPAQLGAAPKRKKKKSKSKIN